MKGYQDILLNGKWEMEYRENIYDSINEPEIAGCVFDKAVPAYWEDMLGEFRETFLCERLKFNPDYAYLRYPIAGYCPDMALPTIIGCFLYKRNFEVESLDGIEKIILSIGGAHNTVRAWINGNYLGEHKGFSAPFNFAVDSSFVKIGQNTVVLAVSNFRMQGYMGRPISGCSSRAANNYTGGIYGDVELKLYNGSLRGVDVSTSIDLKNITVKAVVDGEYCQEYKVSILDGEKVVKSGKILKGENLTTISTEGLTYWSVNNPKRYTVKIESASQQCEKIFGVRRLVADNTNLKLNGEYIYMRGICEHGYYPLTVHPPREKEYYRNVIKTLKKLGFNFIRFHTWVPMPEYLQAADELGMLMEIETPNNTTYEEWKEIVNYGKDYTSALIYSSGNEMIIDEDYIEHLSKCAKLVHENSDSLFSPMSAMRGIEYYDWGEDGVDEPFKHNPRRLKMLGEFCDLYNSYTNAQLSYISASADPEYIDKCNVVYKKPLLSHEICINGTYCDLSVKDRYKGTRIGDTALFSSIEEHLEKKGVLDKAPLYFKNSSEWQRRLRKQCFESTRRCETITGYDYLGDIDHHWHTFGYHVGMMNEFYELKPGETVDNVLRYNSDAVLLADLPYNVNYVSGANVSIPILVSNYYKNISEGLLRVKLSSQDKVIVRKEYKVSNVENGKLTKLVDFEFVMPVVDKPKALKLSVELVLDDKDFDNQWELYVFPKTISTISDKEIADGNLIIKDDIDETELLDALNSGKNVLLFGAGPFASLNTSFQIALAGRTAGHLATVIGDNKLMEEFPHEGFCSWQFRSMLDGGKSVVLDIANVPFKPLVEAVSTYKYVHKEAIVFEYKYGKGKMLVCTFNLQENDPASAWLKQRIISYVLSKDFDPEFTLSQEQMKALFNTNPIYEAENTNMARNNNDITA